MSSTSQAIGKHTKNPQLDHVQELYHDRNHVPMSVLLVQDTDPKSQLHAEMDESWRKLVVRVVGEEATGRPAEEEYFSDLWHPQAEAMILVEYWGIYDKKMEEEMLKDNNAKLRKIAGDILKESGDEGRSDRRH